MEKKYMFICPKCRETYSSDKDAPWRCQSCGAELVRLKISVDEWRGLSDIEKQKYKDAFFDSIEKMNKRSTLKEVVSFISYSVFHFLISGFYLVRLSEIAYYLIGVIVSFLLFWWAKPSLKEWQYNCVNRKWIYLIGGIVLGIEGILAQTKTTHEVAGFLYTYDNTGQKVTLLFYSILLLSKAFYSFRLSKEYTNDSFNKSVSQARVENLPKKSLEEPKHSKDENANIGEFKKESKDRIATINNDRKSRNKKDDLSKDDTILFSQEHTQTTLVKPSNIENIQTTSKSSKTRSTKLESKKDNKKNKNNTKTKTVNKKIVSIENNTINKVRFCRKCGAEISEDSLFCRKCGTKVEV